MKLSHALAGLLLFLLIVVVAGGLIYLPLARNETWDQALQSMGDQPLLPAIAGGVLLAVMVVFLLTGSRRKASGDQFLSFDNEGGTVSISVKAIRDFLGKLGHEFSAITNLQPTLEVRGGAIQVELDVKVRAGTQIPELCRLLQDRVRESIQSNFGLSEVKSVKVNVREIVGSPPIENRDDRGVEPDPLA